MGNGVLPDWLKNLARGGHQLVCLDGFSDNLCLWRSIAVHQGSRPDRSTQKALSLVKRFLRLASTEKPCDVPKTSLDELEKVEAFMDKDKPVLEWLGIRVYEPEYFDGEVFWYLRRNPNKQRKNGLMIGVFNNHAFVIKGILKVAKTFVCYQCNQRFTKVCNLQRHYTTCSKGKAYIDCQNKKNQRTPDPLRRFEKTFYPDQIHSFFFIRTFFIRTLRLRFTKILRTC